MAGSETHQDHRVTQLLARWSGDKAALVDVVSIDLALNRLAAVNPGHSRIVELRFFGGLTIEEAAVVTGLSHSTVERYWTFARAWLRRELGNQETC